MHSDNGIIFKYPVRAKKNANSIAYQKNINIGEPLTQIPILLDLLINLHLLVNVLVVICQSAYH